MIRHTTHHLFLLSSLFIVSTLSGDVLAQRPRGGLLRLSGTLSGPPAALPSALPMGPSSCDTLHGGVCPERVLHSMLGFVQQGR